MTPDDNLTVLIDRVLAQLRSPLETSLHVFAQNFQHQASAAQAAAVDDAVAAVRRESQTQLDQLRDELAQVRRALDTEVTQIQRLAAAEIAGARRQMESQLDESSSVLAAARRETEDARRQTQEMRSELDRVHRKLHDAADAAERERAALQQSLNEVRLAATLASETLSGVTARTQQIVEAVRAIDGAGAIGDVLDRLAQAAKSTARRTVLLMVRGAQLTAWRAGDFPDLATTTLTVDSSGMIGRAVSLRRPVVRLDGTCESEAPLPAFATDGRTRDAVALPLVLDGEAVAVLYADAVRGSGDARRWPLALDVVTRYASRVIETMTLQRSVGLSTTRGPQPRQSESAS